MRVLLVDDDEGVRAAMREILELQGYEVVSAANVSQALVQIVSSQFDVLVTDLHMPDPSDGFAVVTAMRHFQPGALTVIISGFPDVDAAMRAISIQADEILAKPIPPREFVEILRKAHFRRPLATRKQTVAAILERNIDTTLQHWLFVVKKTDELLQASLTDEERIRHLPEILGCILNRLSRMSDAESSIIPAPATLFGECRRSQGYSAFMLAQEWRILQSSIFETIQRNLHLADLSLVIPDLILIADEVHAQLNQSINGYFNANANGVDNAV
jgi:DNA-binding NarL/FixJ family response regulator